MDISGILESATADKLPYSPKLSKEEEYIRVRTFLLHIVNGVAPLEAIVKSGLKTYYYPFTLLERGDCKQLLVVMMKDRTETIHAPKALQFLASTLDDAKATRRVKVDCAKHLLNLAGFQPPKVTPTAKSQFGTPSEMTASEIQAQIDKLESELNQKARSAVVVNPPAAEIDIFS